MNDLKQNILSDFYKEVVSLNEFAYEFSEIVSNSYGNGEVSLKILLFYIVHQTIIGNIRVKYNKKEDILLTLFYELNNFEVYVEQISDFCFLMKDPFLIIKENSAIFGSKGSIKPVIICEHFCYIYKYYIYEEELKSLIDQRLKLSDHTIDEKIIDNVLFTTSNHAKICNNIILNNNQIDAIKKNVI